MWLQMAWSYTRLWVMLVYKGVKRSQLTELAGLSTGAIAKMGKNQPVSLEVLGKLCGYFHCKIEDLVEYVPEDGEQLSSTSE